jgi:glyoxylase-like metal-dependent hydrolase (beta-lactamase superfamily II)
MSTTPIARENTVTTLDLNFRGLPGTIAVYLIPHANGVVLVECGPGSTIPALQAGLQANGFTVSDITDVLLTHIHLDHGGAAGWLARQGARIHVHPVGAPHLLNPEKLLSSAARIYGDMMQTLWGDFLAVPEDRLSILEDNQELQIGTLRFKALNTPGHAYHHYIYLFQDICFSGDIGGVRVQGANHLRIPMPPPEFNLELWRFSLQRLEETYTQGGFHRIAPTHFGVFSDPDWHLNALKRILDETEAWILEVMPANLAIEELNERFLAWTRARSEQEGMASDVESQFEAANPSYMSAQGIYRYWHKVRNVSQ